MELNPNDIRIDYFRSPNQGNWLASSPIGVRITYLPTGKMFESYSARSGHRNKAICFEELIKYLENKHDGCQDLPAKQSVSQYGMCFDYTVFRQDFDLKYML